MKRLIVLAAAAITMAACCGETHIPKAEDYRTSDPAVEKLLQHIRRKWGTGELNSVMVVKDGKKVVEYYDACYGPDFLNICWSASKTFTATAVGLAVEEGLISLDSSIVCYLKPEQLPEHVSDTLKGITIHNLLRMSSGIKTDPIGPIGSGELQNPTKVTLEKGFNFYPGDCYRYNSFNTYLLGVAVSNVTGEDLCDYLEPRLFKPLGIKNYHWDYSSEGYRCGGWGLYISTESLAKMGLLFLQKGVYNGKRILSEEWVEKATSAQIYQNPERIGEDDRTSGYGYQMWCNSVGGSRLDGAHGQWSFILPDYNAVIVVTGNCNGTNYEMMGVWEHILPLVK